MAQLTRKDYKRAAEIVCRYSPSVMRHCAQDAFVTFFLDFENFDETKFINLIDKLLEEKRASQEKQARIESLNKSSEETKGSKSE